MSTRRNPQPDPRQAFHATATALADLVRSVVVDAPRTATLTAVAEDAAITSEPWVPGRGAAPRKLRPTHRQPRPDDAEEIVRLSEAVADLQTAVARLEAKINTTGSETTSRIKPGRRAKR